MVSERDALGLIAGPTHRADGSYKSYGPYGCDGVNKLRGHLLTVMQLA